MIGKVSFLVMAAVLLGTVFVMGGLRPLHHDDSFLTTGLPIMAVEIALALCFARGWVMGLFAPADRPSGTARLTRSVLVPLVMLFAAAMVPTVAILYLDQRLDHAPGVTRTLTITRTYTHSHKGSTTYIAVVPATAPPPVLFGSADSPEDIDLPRATWQGLVPGHSTLTLTIHPGRFGLPWYDVVGTMV